MARKEIQVVCKSVFKNGGMSKNLFTKKWIEIINRLEKRKQYGTRNV